MEANGDSCAKPTDDPLATLRALEAEKKVLARELDEQHRMRALLLSLHEPTAIEAERRVKISLHERSEDVELIVPQRSGASVGGLLWAAGLALAQRLHLISSVTSLAAAAADDSIRLHCLELGCGVAALPSLVAAAALGADVLATDTPDIVELAKACAARNEKALSLSSDESGDRWSAAAGGSFRVAAYEWGETPPPGSPYDLILGCDLLYDQDAYAPLAAAIAAALSVQGVALLAFGVRRAEQEAQFFDLLQSRWGMAPPHEVEFLPAEASTGRGPIRIVEVSYPSSKLRHEADAVQAEPTLAGLYL
eukprot:gnl/TRDRNA2_/TRDRNA2_200793_c0_seq1.p1 gnl/TRDRNA2_/TRDRNA2_200793_c0~~gnl/TRDRNA2_/TRDRNA2_200793_c0_seq1.p1  ORF type:complete len:332 (+),score=61.82 gnl/TRDRNA2_/TRDRNA2_200793_c0_seq1:75-998(+)